MQNISKPVARRFLTLSVAAIIALIPASRFDIDLGGIHSLGGQALAKDGSDDGGNSGSGSDSSGSGSSGSDDSSSDDSSGRGSGDDSGGDSDNSGSGSDDDDDRQGRDRDRERDRDGKRKARAGRDSSPSAEIRGAHIEVRYANGFKDEIENGVFERKDPAGRTVSRRPATDADRARLTGAANRLSRSLSNARSRSARTVHVEISGNNVEVRYSDGWKEEVENGRYELKDPNNNTVIQRQARQSDLARLRKLAGR